MSNEALANMRDEANRRIHSSRPPHAITLCSSRFPSLSTFWKQILMPFWFELAAKLFWVSFRKHTELIVPLKIHLKYCNKSD